ncbi:MAG TPA: amino acid deaminase/aldolase [Jatrophihabitans sp.]|jgi:D-serine deaminase-like pyridoxal phosphate-dependent protein
MSELGSVTHRLSAATAALDPPLAALDVAALRRNMADLARRASGTPIRVASKSVRCRWLLENALSEQAFSGIMAYSLAEAIWLVRGGLGNVLIGYPTASRAALRELAGAAELLAEITLMIDSIAHLDFIAAAVGTPAAPIRVCLDVDASLRVGRGPLTAHLGVRRSPIRTPEQAAVVATEALRRPEYLPVGVMFYEAQIAGLPDSSPAVALVKRKSAAELAVRRSEVVAAVRASGAQLEIVNSGGTGSIEISAADPVVTEVTAGSGLYSPTLFDNYRAFDSDPSLYFALPVVRRPAADIATLYGGGYVASGPAKKSRLPSAVDDGLELIGTEGAGEVQTPVRGPGARNLAIGDRVWMRHAKAGELLERFDAVHLVEGSTVTGTVPSYRGEGRNFG